MLLGPALLFLVTRSKAGVSNRGLIIKTHSLQHSTSRVEEDAKLFY